MPSIRETLMRERALARHQRRAQRSEEMRTLESSLIMAIPLGGVTVTQLSFGVFTYRFTGRDVTTVIERLRKKKQISNDLWFDLHKDAVHHGSGRQAGKSVSLAMQYGMGTKVLRQQMQARLYRQKVEPTIHYMDYASIEQHFADAIAYGASFMKHDSSGAQHVPAQDVRGEAEEPERRDHGGAAGEPDGEARGPHLVPWRKFLFSR